MLLQELRACLIGDRSWRSVVAELVLPLRARQRAE